MSKYDKRLADRLQNIRTAIRGADVPAGLKLYVENECDRISVISKKAIRHGAWDLDDTPATQAYSPTSQQIADRYDAQKAVMAAMMSGRKISFMDSDEFRVSQMHTTITKIRRHIEDKRLPLEIHDEVFHFGPKNKTAKKYWIEPKQEEGEA